MSVNTLIDKICSSDKFIDNYHKLLLVSVRTQLPTIQYSKEEDAIDWAYLLSCVSIFVHSENGRTLDIAYRICQATICQQSVCSEYKCIAATYFDMLANLPAINLAKQRNLISDDFLDKVPLEYRLDVKKKEFRNTIIDGDEVTLLNDFQYKVYNEVVGNRVLSISAPTSAGKSFVLMKIMTDHISQNPEAVVVYLVPTRALIQQVEFDIRTYVKDRKISAEISSVPVCPENMGEKPCIFVFTQERLQWLINENNQIAFSLVIVDEAHKISDGSRGILLQQVLQAISGTESIKFIFASPMSANPEELFKVVNAIESQKTISSEIATVNQNLMWISKEGRSTTKWNIDLLSQGEKYRLGFIETERISSITQKLSVLAYRIAGGKTGNLIYANRAADAERIAIQLKSIILSQNVEYVPSTRVLELIKLIKKTIHPDYALTETLKAGVAFHYGNMPLAIRNEIELLFKEGDIAYLVCTSTLIEGVNLPAKSIFIRGPQRGNNTPMNEMDFWNLAGRAGRQGKEFQGNIFCIDAEDNSVWKNGTPKKRQKYRIKSSIETIVEEKSDELISYIQGAGISNGIKNDLDYAYTYFLDAYLQNGSIEESNMCTLYGDDICRRIDAAISSALKSISIPTSILSKNQGVNPSAQQKLFSYFCTANKSADDLIPPYPENDDAREKYMHIIGRISKEITGDPSSLNVYRSILITNWMRGRGLARIIADNIAWHKENRPKKSTASIIRDTMREIEEFARFRFLKYTTCYVDILKYYFESIGDTDSISKIPQISLWLEFGASKQTQISLMSMGFTRTAAVELSDLMVEEDFDRTQCLSWLRNSNIQALDLPNSIVKEIEVVLELMV